MFRSPLAQATSAHDAGATPVCLLLQLALLNVGNEWEIIPSTVFPMLAIVATTVTLPLRRRFPTTVPATENGNLVRS